MQKMPSSFLLSKPLPVNSILEGRHISAGHHEKHFEL